MPDSNNQEDAESTDLFTGALDIRVATVSPSSVTVGTWCEIASVSRGAHLP